MKLTQYIQEPFRGTIFFTVPYSDKEIVKSLGAKWNPSIKKWSYFGYHNEYIKFAKWIMGDENEIVIATDYIYILEAKKKCYRCGKETRVVALGVADYVKLSKEFGDEIYIDLVYDDENISLVSELRPKDIPPKILEYLETNYSLRFGKSTQRGEYYANHCDHCNTIQGDNYVLYEPTATFSTDYYGEKLKDKMSEISVLRVPIGDDIALNWSLIRSSNGRAYTKYGCTKELRLSSTDEDGFISYKELYNL